MKAGLVHVNVNFRYGAEEVRYIIDNADAAFVVFAGEFAGLLDGIRARLSQVRGWFQVDDGTPAAAFAEPYEHLAATGSGARPHAPRSAAALPSLYTGGPPGRRRGVRGRAEARWRAMGGGGSPIPAEPPVASLAELHDRVSARGAGLRHLPACPLMHG